MSSSLVTDAKGQQIVVVTAPDVGLDVGMRFIVVGNKLAEPYFTGMETDHGKTVTAPHKTNARADLG